MRPGRAAEALTASATSASGVESGLNQQGRPWVRSVAWIVQGMPKVAEPRVAQEPVHGPPVGRHGPPARRASVGAAPEEVRQNAPLGPRVAEEVPPPERRAELRNLARGVAGRDQGRDERADRRARDLDDAESEALDRLKGADVRVAPRLTAGEGHVERRAQIAVAAHWPGRHAVAEWPGRSRLTWIPGAGTPEARGNAGPVSGGHRPAFRVSRTRTTKKSAPSVPARM